MPTDHAELAAFLAAAFALLASPGPATLALAGAGAAFGFRTARRFLIGSLSGAALTVALVGSGVAAAMLAHPIVAPVLLALATAYLVFLAYRIATAPPLGTKPGRRRVPAFMSGFVLSIANPKAYAAFATLFSGFVLRPDDVAGDTLLKGGLIAVLLLLIDTGWLFAGDTLRHVFHDPSVSRRINVTFAALLILSVALALVL